MKPIELSEVLRSVIYRGTWRGLATIQRNLDTVTCRITFNNRNDVHKYLNNIRQNNLNVKFLSC